MKTIIKYELPVMGNTIHITSNVLQWLDVQSQKGNPCLWVMVDDIGEKQTYEIMSAGTGWKLPNRIEDYFYIGTVQDNYNCVWHYFAKEIINKKEEKTEEWSVANNQIISVHYHKPVTTIITQ